MDLTTLVIWLLIIVLVYAGWRWHKKGTGFAELARHIQGSLRKGLGAADREALQNIENQLNQFRSQYDARLVSLENQPLSEYPKAFEENRRYDDPSEVEDFSDARLPYRSSVQSSLTWQGLRFTLSDWVWTHIGRTPSVQVTDEQLSSMIQGPFCPRCLKRWIDRAQDSSTSGVPTLCRSCGIPWNNGHLLSDRPLSVIELKRRVYEHLEQAMQNRSINPFPNKPG